MGFLFLRFWFPALVMLGPVPAVQGGPAGPDSEMIVRSLARVDSLLNAGSVAMALAEARALDRKFPGDSFHRGQIESRLGVCLLRSGEPLAALPNLENAIRRAPGQAENHRNLGAALVSLGRKGRALAEYAQAVELAPVDFELRLEFGQLLLDFRDHGEAGRQLRVADRLCGGCPQVQEPLARLFLATGDFAAAVPLLEDLYKRRPTAQVRRSLVQALQGAGRDTQLLDLLRNEPLAGLPSDEIMLLLELEGKLNRLRYSESFARSLVDDPAAGADGVPEAVRNQSGFWGRLSYNLLLANRNTLALAAVDRAITLAPDNVVYRNNRVVLLTRLGRHEEAAREWQRVLALDPTLKESER